MERQRRSSRGRGPPPNANSRNSKSWHTQQEPNTDQKPSNSNPPLWKYRGTASTSSSSTQERNIKGEDFPDFPTLVGTCPHMCPDSERAQRERLRDLAVFERLHGNPTKTSPDLAVKKFCRTISTKSVQPSDIRPLPVLEDTLTYLLNLLDSTDHPFEVVHDFIFDRTRSIRQDLSMQNVIDKKAVDMYEKMVKFYVTSHLKLQDSVNNSNISSARHLNMEQLTKTLSSLYSLYDANGDSSSINEKEAEFRSLHVLLYLDSKNQPTGESLSLWFCHLPRRILHSKEIRFARTILRFFRLGYYKQFLCTVSAEASHLQYCILEPYIHQVRALCLSCINDVGYKLHPYPLPQLSKLLMIKKESDLERLCHACGLETIADEAGKKLLQTKQTTFCIPKGGFATNEFPGLDRFDR